MKTFILTIIICLTISYGLLAQCDTAEEVAVSLTLVTGNFGGDTSWELTDDDTGEVYGANQWYGNNDTFVEKICVPVDAKLTFSITCCFNNDGSYKLEMFGLIIVERAEFQLNEATSFIAALPITLDGVLLSVDFQEYILKQPQTISGEIRNIGTETITDFDIHWQINGEEQLHTFKEVSVEPFTNYNFEIPEKWLPELGVAEVYVWLGDVNGKEDEQIDNNSWQKKLTVSETLSERMVLIENFTNASCSNCVLVDAAFGNLIGNNLYRIAALNYHTNFPGYDLMYEQSKESADARINFYGVDGAPQLVAEGGYYNGFTGEFQSTHIKTFSEKKAIFNILNNEYLINDNEVVIDVNLNKNSKYKPDNLKLFVVVVETQISFEGATEAPGNNGLQDFYYVVREMLPDPNGFDLSDELLANEQPFSFTYKIPEYVKAENLRSVVIIQDIVTKEVFQAYRAGQTMGTDRGGNALLQGTTFGTFRISQQQPSCFTANDGSLNVNPLIENDDFIYKWSTGETTAELRDISGGDYELTVTAEDGQSDSFNIYLPQPEGLDYSIETTADTDGTANGSATVLIVNTSEPLTYEWSDGQIGETAQNLSAGTYTVIVTNAYACPQTITVNIEEVVTGFNNIYSTEKPYIYQTSLQGRQLGVRLAATEEQHFTASIFDTSGKLVKQYFQAITSSELTDYQFGMDDLAIGIYVVNVRLGTHNISQILIRY